jgi:hypothetical protein
MNRFLLRKHWFVVPLVAALANCGGGTDGTGATPPQASATSSGVMTKGSVILNGVHYDDSRATISDDRNRTSAQLATGMVVKLRGRNDGTTGTAEKIQVENEVRGPIQSVNTAANPQSFVVGGLTVLVDAQTAYANVANFAALAAGSRVEVHGLRDSLNNVHASRVELVGAASAAEGFDEVRGTVSGLVTGTKTFTLNGNLTVNYTAATFAPTGASEASLNGANVVVEVHGTLANNTFNATQIDIESLEDTDFRGNANEKQEVEGFVTGFTATPGTFQVNGRTVTTTASTTFVNGTAVDLANNVEVEAEGTIDNNGVLVATKIQFEGARVQIEGKATAVNVGARTVQVLGQTVQANDLTRIDTRTSGGGNSTSLADITAGVDCVQIRGSFVGGVFVADEIKEPSGCGKDLVQALVTGKDAAAFTLQFFGVLNASLGSTAQYRDRNGLVLTRDVFLAAVTPAAAGSAGTLVKVKGTLTNGVLVAEEAEIEN